MLGVSLKDKIRITHIIESEAQGRTKKNLRPGHLEACKSGFWSLPDLSPFCLLLCTQLKKPNWNDSNRIHIVKQRDERWTTQKLYKER